MEKCVSLTDFAVHSEFVSTLQFGVAANGANDVAVVVERTRV